MVCPKSRMWAYITEFTIKAPRTPHTSSFQPSYKQANISTYASRPPSPLNMQSRIRSGAEASTSCFSHFNCNGLPRRLVSCLACCRLVSVKSRSPPQSLSSPRLPQVPSRISKRSVIVVRPAVRCAVLGVMRSASAAAAAGHMAESVVFLILAVTRTGPVIKRTRRLHQCQTLCLWWSQGLIGASSGAQA